jgi:hypothetical protein
MIRAMTFLFISFFDDLFFSFFLSFDIFIY